MKIYWLLVFTLLLGLFGAGYAWGAGTRDEIESLSAIRDMVVLVPADALVNEAGLAPDMIQSQLESRLRENGITPKTLEEQQESFTNSRFNIGHLEFTTVTVKDDATDRYFMLCDLRLLQYVMVWNYGTDTWGCTWQTTKLVICDSAQQLPEATIAYLEEALTAFSKDYRAVHLPMPTRPGTLRR